MGPNSQEDVSVGAPLEDSPNPQGVDSRQLAQLELASARDTAMNWLHNHSANNRDREDIAQEAILCAWLAFDRFIGDKKDFDKWFETIVRNKTTDFWRKGQRGIRTRSFEDLGLTESTFSQDGSVEFPVVYRQDPPWMIDNTTSFSEEFITTRESLKQALETIANWPVGLGDIRVLVLHRYWGMTHKQIAEELNISVNASKARLFRLERHLAKTAVNTSQAPETTESEEGAGYAPKQPDGN